jgi:hypothetical protein
MQTDLDDPNDFIPAGIFKLRLFKLFEDALPVGDDLSAQVADNILAGSPFHQIAVLHQVVDC